MGVFVDNKYYKSINLNYTVLQFCISIGISVPFFCYHELLSIAGNCRMCLLEVNNILIASCAIQITDNMIINTSNKRVRLARESVLEFLLVNHPLDCPICDQGGECDLQDISMTYGSDKGRFYEEYKRSVTNLNCCGPLIKTIMTRCIHCTRCVRFLNEISDNFNLGVIGRGSSMEIGSYIQRHISDQLIGNIIDLCPVGALTSMTFSYKTRVWKLISIRSIDILDSLTSSIRIDTHNNKIMRIVPSLDGLINEEWITNKARYSYDALSIQRIYNPKICYNTKFIIISWAIAFNYYTHKIYKFKLNYIQAFCGPFFDLYSSFYIKKFFNSFGCSNISYFENQNMYPIYDFRIYYILNKTIIELEMINNMIYIGTNLRIELPLLNLRVRKNYLQNKNIICYSFGLSLNQMTYPVINLGCSIKTIKYLIEGKFYSNFLIFFYDYFSTNNFSYYNIIKNYFFLGMSVVNRKDADSILYCFHKLYNKFKYYNYLNLNIISRFLGRISAFELGILPGINSNMLNNRIYNNSININHYCGVDHDINKIFLLELRNINIYQGPFYINELIKYMWLILPTISYTEDHFSYLNLEGRHRSTQIAIKAPINYNDSKIFTCLTIFKNKLVISNFSIIKNFFSYLKIFNNIINFNNNYHIDNYYLYSLTYLQNNNKKFLLLNFLWISTILLVNSLISKNVYNFYLVDPICKNSKILTLASKYENYI